MKPRQRGDLTEAEHGATLHVMNQEGADESSRQRAEDDESVRASGAANLAHVISGMDEAQTLKQADEARVAMAEAEARAAKDDAVFEHNARLGRLTSEHK